MWNVYSTFVVIIYIIRFFHHDNFIKNNHLSAWYDATQQTEHQDTELERVFDERKELASQSVDTITDHHLSQKIIKEPQTEWQKNVKEKKREGYYNKLMNLEEEQVLKESRLREASHQFAIPGDKVVKSSLAKGMAQKYQENL